MLGWGLIIAFVGMVVAAIGTPRRDRRYRTGFKENAEPADKVIQVGLFVFAVGALLVLHSIRGCLESVDSSPRGQSSDLGQNAAIRDMSTAATRPDMMSPKKRQHARPSTLDPH